MKIKIKNILTELDDEDLKQIEKTGTFIIPEGIDELGDGLFGCTHLKSIVIPASVDYIGDLAFSDCLDLEEITFKGNPKIGENAFENCKVKLIITSNKTSKQERSDLRTRFVEAGGNYTYSYPEGNALITLIKTGVYTIPDNVDVIESSAFQGADVLEKLIVSANTRMIEKFAFYDCPNLKEIIFKSAPKLGMYAFPTEVEKVVISGGINPSDRERLINELTEYFGFYDKKVDFVIDNADEDASASE